MKLVHVLAAVIATTAAAPAFAGDWIASNNGLVWTVSSESEGVTLTMADQEQAEDSAEALNRNQDKKNKKKKK